MTESFIHSFTHNFMFTCDTLPSHLCPCCFKIKQSLSAQGHFPTSQASSPVPWSKAMCAVPWGQVSAECPSSRAGEQRKHSRGTSIPSKVPLCQQRRSRTLLSHSHYPWGAAGPGKGCECSRAGIQAEQARAVLQQALEHRGAAGTSRHGRGQPAVCHMARRN